MCKCLVCHQDAQVITKDFLIEEVTCPHCGHYHYEKPFKTSYDYFLSQQNQEDVNKIIKQMKKIIKKENVCFVDDFEKSLADGCALYELLDILNPIGMDVAHNNTIDSNYKD